MRALIIRQVICNQNVFPLLQIRFFDLKKQNDAQTAPNTATIRRANVTLSPVSALRTESSIPRNLTVALLSVIGGAAVPAEKTQKPKFSYYFLTFAGSNCKSKPYFTCCQNSSTEIALRFKFIWCGVAGLTTATVASTLLATELDL